MDPTALDQVQLNFNPQGLFVINAAIGLMMLGVALELKLDDFKRIFIAPKAPAIGLGAQFILLPALTFLLTLILTAAAVNRPGHDSRGRLPRRQSFQYHYLSGTRQLCRIGEHDRCFHPGGHRYDPFQPIPVGQSQSRYSPHTAGG